MNWIQGVFQYIEKLWHGVRCFFLNFYHIVIDLLRGFYREVMDLMISLLGIIPAPAALMDFSFGAIPQFFMWAIHDLGLRDGLLLITAGATVRLTRQLLAMVAK